MSCSAKETTLVSLIVVLIGTTIKLLSLVIVVLKRFFLICYKFLSGIDSFFLPATLGLISDSF